MSEIEPIVFRKEGSALTAKLLGRMIVLGFAFVFAFAGPYDWTLRRFGKDATWMVLFLLVTLTFVVPRFLRRLKREELVVTPQGVIYRVGFREVRRIGFSELSGYRELGNRFAGGGIELLSQTGAPTFSMSASLADPAEVAAALERMGLRALG